VSRRIGVALLLLLVGLVAHDAAEASGWTRLADPPFTRGWSAHVWNGKGLLVWGGAEADGTFPAGGAFYDAGSRLWQPVSAAPIAGRADPAAAWTGSELLVWGGWGRGTRVFGDGAAYDPAHDSWRRLPPAPLTARAPAAWLWTGKEFLVWGSSSRSHTVRDGAAYDPATNRWRRLPAAPLALDQANAVWLGGEMIVYGAHLDNGNQSLVSGGMAYAPATNRWRVLAPFPLSPQASTIAAVAGKAVVWDYGLKAASYDPHENRWTPLPKLPLRGRECYPSSATVAGLVVGWYCEAGAVLSRPADNWRPFRLPRQGLTLDRVIGGGSSAYFFGTSANRRHAELWAYNPS
jgi:hypothetical protein